MQSVVIDRQLKRIGSSLKKPRLLGLDKQPEMQRLKKRKGLRGLRFYDSEPKNLA